ncbi:5'-nucleotidase, lipoprotein e(P4) family [Shewanella yunxiaonensis]|uniref:5'-nucleotidase, lipoprotein e(P4) family n=1 Tax=Shewanella yunxiaonensis TaxID=2829809 RepID=A0ABX7YSX7_9GAMM|nr:MULTISPECIES: 5'-nucleotidase, lipoprotein e(P4) family [Shewanella]MDF0534099.1 5'-nucleotidase, lipoprotein e(P4) family [Shewanella sp. A32]QUN05416.1 5'-nucleotidase, lipoprotein e(P4) family [Shewanella yunxiaonensis]
MKALISVLPLVFVAATSFAKTTPETSELVTQNTQSVLWMQNAGEYRALCYQAYNTAQMAFDAAKATQKGKLAVMVDLDETMLDNSPYAAWQIQHQQPFASSSWDNWVNAVQTPALHGAVAFAKYVTDNGGTMFYVSNRSDRTFAATKANLIKDGFPNVSDFTLRLKKDTSDKAPRMQSIEADGYKVVLFLGDNLNDFPELNTYHKLNADRNAAVDAHQQQFGRHFILLPNPSYGDWEPGLGKGYYQLSEQQKAQLRNDSLKPWNGQ